MNGVQLYRRLLQFSWPYRWVFVLGVLGMVSAAGAETAFAALLKPIMDGGFVERDQTIIRLTPLLLIGVFVIRGAGGFIDHYCVSWVARKVVFDLRDRMFDTIIRLPTVFYESHSSASLVSKLIYDVEQVAQACTSAVRIFIKDSLLTIALLIWMTYLSWQLTLIFLTGLPFVAIVVRASSKRFRTSSQRIQSSMGGIAHVAKEAFQGHRVVKAYVGQEEESRKFLQANARNRRQAMKKALVSAATVPLMTLVVGLSVALIIYLAMSGIGGRIISAGTFVSYLGTVLMLMPPIKRLARVNEIIQSGVAAANSAFTILDQVPETTGGTLKANDLKGRIEFSDVTFRYSEDKPVALDDVSFSVEPGETVAFVGASGSGKSTAVALLLGFYPLSQGSIRIDNREINDYDLPSLRSNIALVSQDAILFDDSIVNNIRYAGGSDKDTDKIRQIAEAAQVAEFADRLPEGLQTQVGEQGGLLSGGQRQRVAIARALFKDAPILVLDEATSALDNESERKVRESIRNLAGTRTLLVIAHRLSTVVDADHILVFSEGRIVESGTHDNLMSKGGFYNRLYRSQERETKAQVASP